MSTAELSPGVPAAGPGALPDPGVRPAPARAWLRLMGSELRLVFGRKRNLALLAVVAVIPIIIGIGLKLAGDTGPNGAGGGGPAFLGDVTGNGVFLSFLALVILLTLVLPLVVAVVAGDSIAGEAGYGTLRYLLAVPAGRARLLTVKYLTVVVFGLAATAVVSAVSLATGVVLFPVGPVTLLSGTTVSLADGLLRLVLVTLYVAAGMAALAAIGVAISTFTLAVLTVASEVADNVPQFSAVQPYLPTHWWLMFDSLLRSPVDTTTLLHGLLSFAIYIVIFGCIAWARFTSSDITS
jgi:ABC-2 type transport system permease protein